MAGKLRIDVVGQNEFSQSVGVDTDQVVSSIKIDVINRTVVVYYKRKEDGKPLTLDELTVEENDGSRKSELLDSIAPVNETATQSEPAPTPLLGVVGPDLSDEDKEDLSKMDAHVEGDLSGDGEATGPTVTTSGGTPTVDGKKPTTGGKRPTSSTKG